MSSLPPDKDTRAEYWNSNKNDEPGYLARTRKATMAGAVALAGALSTAAIGVSQDGVITADEAIVSGVIALGIGAAAWFATWAVPNA